MGVYTQAKYGYKWMQQVGGSNSASIIVANVMAAPSLIKLPLKLLLILIVLLLKVQAHFVLQYEIVSISTHVTNCGKDESTPECEIYLSDFCLREGRNTLSNDTSDCPLGSGSIVDQYPAIREIMSQQPWTVSPLILHTGLVP